MRLALVVALTLLIAGCSGGGGKAQSREDCTDDENYNSFEQRCVSDFEVCRAWLSGQASADEDEVTCQVDSDGRAWLDWGFGVTQPIHVTVTDGQGKVVYENNISNDQDRAKMTGAKGAWRLTVDFGDATGTGEVYLWG